MLRVDQWQLAHQSFVPVIPHFKQVLSQKASQLIKRKKGQRGNSASLNITKRIK